MNNREINTSGNLEELILQAKGGNKRAFRSLVEMHQRFAYAVAFKILLNDEDAKDAAQESFIRLWKHIGKYRFDSKFTTWFYKIVINMSLDKLKSRKRKEGFEQFRLSDREVENILSKESGEYSNQEFVDIVNKLSHNLSPKQKQVFTLRDLNGLELAEVAGVLNISVGSVKSNLVYARKKIKEYLTTIYNWE